MRIAKVSNKKVGKKEYHKYMIPSIPEDIVIKSGLLGKDLKAIVEKGKIVLEKE